MCFVELLAIFMVDKSKVTQAINQFFSDKRNGSAWRRILFEAPAYAMERLAIAMYYTVFGKSMTREEKEEYRALREEIDATLAREDLEYLIKVMPEGKKDHYKALLSLLPAEKGEPTTANQKAEATAAQ